MKKNLLAPFAVFLLLTVLLSAIPFFPVSAESGTAGNGKEYYFDFENYPLNASVTSGDLVPTGNYNVVTNAGDSHKKVLYISASDTASTMFTLDTGYVDKIVTFDFVYSGNFGTYGGIYTAVYENGNDSVYTIFSPVYHFQLKDSRAANSVLDDCGYGLGNSSWYRAKLIQIDNTVYAKVWSEADTEPQDWNVCGQTTLSMKGEGSHITIQMAGGGDKNGCGAYVDNLRVAPLSDAEREEVEKKPTSFAIKVLASDAKMGTVTGGGDYAPDENVTLTAKANAGYVFKGWQFGDTLVGNQATLTFRATRSATYTAVFVSEDYEPKYVYYTDNFEQYDVGPANKDTMPIQYIYLADAGDYQITSVDLGNGKSTQVLSAHTYTVNNENQFTMNCEIVNKEISFDFQYDKAFSSYGGIYVKLHLQPGKNGDDGYYFSLNPNYSSNIIVSSNDRNLGSCKYSFSPNKWYSVKGRIYNNVISVKVWEQNTPEPESWNFTQKVSGFTMKAANSYFGMELFNVPNASDVNVKIDNIVMKTWEEIAAKEQYTLSLQSADAAMGTVSGAGQYVEGNSVKAVANPARGYSFVCWKDENGNEVSTDAVYRFLIDEDVQLTACFEVTQVQIRSFMAEGLTTVAEIDDENKTVTLRFASDVDLANVYPYYYLDTGIEVDQSCYTQMDLSSGRTVVGNAHSSWTILATQNDVMQRFYVNGKTGNDKNDGKSPEKAFKTLEAAKDAVSVISKWSGDVVVNVAAGTYSLSDTLAFTTDDSAERGYAVIWQGETGNPNDVILTGGDKLNGEWIPSTDVTVREGLAAWEYDATGLPYSRDLYVNGEMAQLSKMLLDDTTAGSWDLADIADLKIDTSFGYIASGKLASMCDWRNPSDIEFAYEVGWTYSIVPVESIEEDGDNSRVEMFMDAFTAALTKSGVQICDPNFILNCFEGLDEAGEWYFDREAGKIYYITKNDENPNDMKIVLPTLDRLITVDGEEDDRVCGFTLKDMTFAYTSYLRPHTYGQAEVQASFIVNEEALTWDYYHQHDYFLKTDGGITVSYAEAARVSHCIFTNMSASAFDFEEGCIGCQFVRSTVKNVGANGISVGGVSVRDAQPYSKKAYVNGVLTTVDPDPARVTQYTLILSNSVDGVGLQFKGSIGIFAGHVADVTIAHNTITNASYSGISCGWGWGAWDGAGNSRTDTSYYRFPDTASVQARYVIEYNDISNVCQRLADGGTFYSLSLMPGSKLIGNLMHDSPVKFGGIYFDEGTGGFTEISDNITYNCYQDYFYHLTGGFSQRKADMDALVNNGRNYIGVTPKKAADDARYKSIVFNAGTLVAMQPAQLQSDEHEHVFGEWSVVKPATETEEGIEERVCSVCGEVETRSVPTLALPTDQPSGDTAKMSNGGIALLVSAVVAVLVGVTVLIVFKKKKAPK